MCKCFETVNASLAQQNGRLAVAFQITGELGVRSRLLVATEKIDKTKRKSPPTVAANFCPFCGEKADNL